MLTLDQSTLFYFLLNSKPEPFKKGINGWASNVDVSLLSGHAKPNTRQGSKVGSSKSVITTKSTLVDNVIISRKVEVNPWPNCSVSPLENLSLFQDEDEMADTEHGAAIASPIKGRGRLMSSVNKYCIIYHMLADLSTSRTLL
jgi:hypothetical protein